MNHLSFNQLVAILEQEREETERHKEKSKERRGWRSGIKRGGLSVMETTVKLPSSGGSMMADLLTWPEKSPY
ncbi:hypothetical protein Hanom_Chr03g00227351 [Helianthus anomalus]